MTDGPASGASQTEVPRAYRDGYARARAIDPQMADRYIAHTRMGDPLADAVVAELANHSAEEAQHWIATGIEQGLAAIPDAPPATRAFFEAVETPPDWFDPARTGPGCRGFHRHSEMFLGAFVGAVLIEGFSTLISQSFSITGRIVDSGVRRLKQNNRHLVEIFMPGGLDRDGDGWKLSIRIRLVHARVRHMLDGAPDWDPDWGLPLSSAHISYATAAFSGLLLYRARMLGVHLTPEEEESFMMIWRYSGHLMGVPEEMQCGSLDSALHLQKIGHICEPPPTLEAILLCNGLINSAPVVAGIDKPRSRKALTRYIYRVSRAMIGDEMADALNYPRMRTFGTLTTIRAKNRGEALLYRMVPKLGARNRAKQFQTMLDVSFHDPEGIGYRLPRHLHAERDGLL
ncbi:oxygenase MpaB family protein [Pseudooceanicola sp. HF7]|uniref:oxygenase MpaB family protein n=1 Tax=Pseudooceanicola sp. HF7 TaxID=2721560 RepID=UPI00143006FB|nr:oxygenase MpaB family protein [Pseudooceanicola sp. HF7]NIZ07945.1 DUF2236 domain-containing protein [Pseudooceanicola sp. HF7]